MDNNYKNTNNDINNVSSITNTRSLGGKIVRDEILKSLKDYILKNNLSLSFAIISIGDDEASKIYIKQKEKMAEEIGFKCNIYSFSTDVTMPKVLDVIDELNKDVSINGIIVQLPIPDSLDKVKILNSIDYRKDIEGLTNINLGKLVNKEKGLYPATASGIIKLLNYYNIPMLGKNVLIINRSTLVGKPLALMMLNEGATVTVAHSQTNNLNSILKNFDIIVSAAGKKDLIKEEYVDKNAILVDVGVSRIDNKVHGDIEDSLKLRNISSPTIGGVGPLTIAMLATNIVEAYKLQNNIDND